MAHKLEFVYNGGTYSISQPGTSVGGTARLMSYTPTYGGDDAETVHEEAVVELSGSTNGALGTSINILNKLLAAGRDWVDNRSHPICYIQFQPDNYADAYRSPMLGGMIVHTEDKTINYPYWDARKMEVTISWERNNYWERETIAPVYVSNANYGTAYDGTTDREVFIANSNGRYGAIPNKLDNSVMIRAVDLAGDLPAPAMLQITAGTAYPEGIAKYYIGNHYTADTYTSANYTTLSERLFLEGEASSLGGSVTQAGNSGTAYISGTITTANETNLFQWALAAGTNAYVPKVFNGNLFHLMARFAGTSSLNNTKFRWKMLGGTTVMWSGPQFSLSTPGELIQDMGVINIPPGNVNTWSNDFNLRLTGQLITGTLGTINLDFVQIMGANFTTLTGLNPLANSEILTYGEIVGQNSLRRSNPVVYGDWIYRGADAMYLDPRFTNYLNVLYQSTTGTLAPINGTAGIAMYYYPRRRTL